MMDNHLVSGRSFPSLQGTPGWYSSQCRCRVQHKCGPGNMKYRSLSRPSRMVLQHHHIRRRMRCLSNMLLADHTGFVRTCGDCTADYYSLLQTRPLDSRSISFRLFSFLDLHGVNVPVKFVEFCPGHKIFVYSCPASRLCLDPSGSRNKDLWLIVFAVAED